MTKDGSMKEYKPGSKGREKIWKLENLSLKMQTSE
jgi:hypothetical protein